MCIRDSPAPAQSQLGLFQSAPDTHPIVDRVKALDLERMTPIDALNLLAELKREADR